MERIKNINILDTLEVGSDGSHFKVDNKGNSYISATLQIGQETNQGYNFYVNGTSRFNGQTIINGSAGSLPLIVRGIVGSDGSGNIGDLHLQFGANLPIRLGNTAAYSISADGSQYSGNSASATKLTSSAGSATRPIYFSGGKPIQCSTSLSDYVTWKHNANGLNTAMIQYRDNPSGGYGHGIGIGGGGLSVLGGGESATLVLNNRNADEEVGIVSSDSNVEIITNLQSNYSSGKHFIFSSGGNLTIPGSVVIGDRVNKTYTDLSIFRGPAQLYLCGRYDGQGAEIGYANSGTVQSSLALENDNIIASTNFTIEENKNLQMRYNSKKWRTIFNHNNGNISINAAGAGLYLGYWDTQEIYCRGSYINIDSGNIGNQSVNYANSAGNSDTVDGHHFHWSGQGGQPAWLWGGNDSTNQYVYNPSNFSVNYASYSGWSYRTLNDPYRSGRDFPSGTLITTDLDGGGINSALPFYLEIKGNGYSSGRPLFAQAQGYVYHLGNGYRNYINCGGNAIGPFCDYIQAFNRNGYLCFWFPNMGYWQGFDVSCYNCLEHSGSKQSTNHVTSIVNSGEPSGSWKTTIQIARISYGSGNPSGGGEGSVYYKLI